MAKSILLINGPNLNLLGYREPSIYGSVTLSDVKTDLDALCTSNNASITYFQSNSESDIIDRIQAIKYPEHLPSTSTLHSQLADFAKLPPVDAIVINAGAFTHTSVAIRDALGAVGVPFVEIHVSNVHKREAFRHHSYLSDKAEAVIAGLGTYGYRAAVEFCIKHLKVA